MGTCHTGVLCCGVVKQLAARVKNIVFIKISLTADCDAVGKHCRAAVRAFHFQVRQSGEDSARERRTAASSAAEGEAIILVALAFRAFPLGNRASHSGAANWEPDTVDVVRLGCLSGTPPVPVTAAARAANSANNQNGGTTLSIPNVVPTTASAAAANQAVSAAPLPFMGSASRSRRGALSSTRNSAAAAREPPYSAALPGVRKN